jgi:MscS family membrane protein
MLQNISSHLILLGSSPGKNVFNDTYYFGEKLSNYIWCVAIILGTLLLKRPIAVGLARFSAYLSGKISDTQLKLSLRGRLRKPMERLLQVVLYYVAINQLSDLLDNKTLHHFLNKKDNIDVRLSDVSDHVFLFLFIVFLTQTVSGIIDFLYNLRLEHARMEQNTSRLQLLPLIKEMSKLLLWIFSIFALLGAVFHVNIPALIAGLGVGGIAVALAGKETVENLFAAMTILSDKPFQTGDVIKLGDMEGTVERIGFRSTRLRHADGSALIIPNQKLVGENLRNISWRSHMGIKLLLYIKYGLSTQQVEAMINEIKAMLLKHELVIAPVDIVLEAYGEKTFQLAVSYHLPSPLPNGKLLPEVKHEISFAAYAIITAYVGDNNASIPS